MKTDEAETHVRLYPSVDVLSDSLKSDRGWNFFSTVRAASLYDTDAARTGSTGSSISIS